MVYFISILFIPRSICSSVYLSELNTCFYTKYLFYKFVFSCNQQRHQFYPTRWQRSPQWDEQLFNFEMSFRSRTPIPRQFSFFGVTECCITAYLVVLKYLTLVAFRTRPLKISLTAIIFCDRLQPPPAAPKWNLLRICINIFVI